MTLPRLLFACLALGGCATSDAPSLPICDGAARRPANPHGSILAPAAPPTPDQPVEPTAPPSGGCA